MSVDRWTMGARTAARSLFRRAGGSLLAVGALAAGTLAMGPPATGIPDPGLQEGDAGAAARKPAYYVRAGRGGAPVYNIFDTKGHVLRRAPESSLLAVYSERSGFLEVESPGGLPVWVFGQYLIPTGQAGLYEVTGDSVLLRPRPTSKQSFPLRTKLFRGDRVRMIERAAPEKPFHEDWVRVWSPPGTRAWVLASAVIPVIKGTDVTADWARDAQIVHKELATTAAEAAAPQKPVSAEAGEATTSGASAQKAPTGKEANELARQALADAQARFAAVGVEEADLTELREAFELVVELAPDSSHADEARGRLREIAVREEIAALREDIEADRERREVEAARLRQDLARQEAKDDPLWGRFQARGWLELEEPPGEDPIYVVRWAGQVKAVAQCSSGRYDLAVFEGFEVGLNGLVLGKSKYAGGGLGMRADKMDIARIEVISGRFER